jgi:hypothetical protein
VFSQIILLLCALTLLADRLLDLLRILLCRELPRNRDVPITIVASVDTAGRE